MCLKPIPDQRVYSLYTSPFYSTLSLCFRFSFLFSGVYSFSPLLTFPLFFLTLSPFSTPRPPQFFRVVCRFSLSSFVSVSSLKIPDLRGSDVDKEEDPSNRPPSPSRSAKDESLGSQSVWAQNRGPLVPTFHWEGHGGDRPVRNKPRGPPTATAHPTTEGR